MTKDSMLQILDINKEIIKNTFSIDDSGIDNIVNFLSKERKNFKEVIDDIFLSDMNIREKMFMYYLIGYDNGKRTKRLKTVVDK